MREIIKVTGVLFLGVIMVLTMFFTPAMNNVKSKYTIHDVQVHAGGHNITPLTTPVTQSIWTRPGDLVTAPVYTPEGRQLGFIPETGMVVTNCGMPLVSRVGAHAVAVLYDEANSTFIDAANRTLQIYLDSRLGRHQLRSGGVYLTNICMDREVVKIGLNTNSGSIPIFAFRSANQRSWYQNLRPSNWGRPAGYVFRDMNGREISNNQLVHINQTNWVAIVSSVVSPPVALINLFSNNFVVPVVQILDRSTLRELYAKMEHATWHPWEALQCNVTNQLVRTTDGEVIRINPRNGQLVERFGWALFCTTSALPILYRDGRLMSVTTVPQTVQNGVLMNSMTVWSLLRDGTLFYMGIVETAFGSFDVPLFNWSYDPANPDWRLMNGESAAGVVIDHRVSRAQEGESFSDWWARVSGDIGEGLDTLTQILAIVAGIILLILFAKVMMLVFDILSALVPKRKGGGR